MNKINKNKRVATVDILNKIKNSGNKKIKANFFDLFFASSRKWLEELGIKTKKKGAKFPVMVDHSGNFVYPKEYFHNQIENEDTVKEILKELIEINDKYALIDIESYETLSYIEKIKLIREIYDEVINSNITLLSEEKEKLNYFTVINIPYDYILEDFNVQKVLSSIGGDLSNIEYLNSREKFYADIMYNCYVTIDTLKIKIDSNAINGLRKYFTKNLDKFLELDKGEISNQIYSILKEYSITNSLERIQFSDVEKIIVLFDKIPEEVSTE